MDTPFEFQRLYEFERHPDWPVDVGISAGCLLGYVFAWVGLVSAFHPNHWAAGMIGALAGCFVGWAWYRLVVIRQR